MHKTIQAVLLWVYRASIGTGVLETRPGKWFFTHAYGIYKQCFEARSAGALRSLVRPGSTVVDVGANIGFFTVRFARWTGPSGRVIAIEPEARNLRLLRGQLAKAGVAATVDVVEAVAAEAPGTVLLALSPHHPTDHRISDRGVPVRACTVDDLVEEHAGPAVSLIKIDVQGAEVRVLRGALRTIRRFRPILLIEVHDRDLAEAGFSADMLLDEVEAQGYRIYDPEHPDRPQTRAEASLRRRSLGYADILCRE